MLSVAAMKTVGLHFGNRRAILQCACVITLLLALVCVPTGAASAEDSTDEFPYMSPDDVTFQKWVNAYTRSPRAESAFEARSSSEPGGSMDLLSHLDYVPSERSQGQCANCWAWAGTGCMEIALDVQAGVYDRLSVQYINSCQTPITGNPCCDGGWLSGDFDHFYEETGRCIPWDNTNAHWQDGDAGCDVACGTIVTEPHYDITYVDAITVPTHTGNGEVASDAEAIATIKSTLDSGQAIWFAFFVKDYAAWSQFASFWLYQDETSVCDMEALCSGSSRGPGHAIMCVGYNDDAPEPYWLMLNSWGTANGNRPNGLFRMKMHMDYDTRCAGSYAFYWQTLDIDFGLSPEIAVTPSFLDCTVLQNQSEDIAFSISNTGLGSLTFDVGDTEPEGSGTPPVSIDYDDGVPEEGQAGDEGTRYAVRFTPATSPTEVLSTDVHLWDSAPPWPDSNHEEFRVEVYDDDGAGGAPGTLLGDSTYTADDWGWQTIDLSDLDITVPQGDYYVAYRFLSDSPNCEALSFDTSSPDSRSWYRSDTGDWVSVADSPVGPGDWLIRSSYQDADCPWLSEWPDAGTVPSEADEDIVVTVDASGLSPGDREGTVFVCSNDPASPVVSLPVTVTVLPAADLVPTILCAEWTAGSSEEYTVTIGITNEGEGTAASSTGRLFMDSVEVAVYNVPELAPGEAYITQHGPVTLTDDADDLHLVVDTEDDVSPEGNEDNNGLAQTVAAAEDAQIQLVLQEGWNMVSIPLRLDDSATSSIFPGAEAVYTWNPATKSYFMPDEIEPRVAYWVAMSSQTSIDLVGPPVVEYVTDLVRGWHMLGSVHGHVAMFEDPLDAPSDSVEGFAYSWNAQTRSYDLHTSLVQGLGYWVAASDDCLLEIS